MEPFIPRSIKLRSSRFFLHVLAKVFIPRRTEYLPNAFDVRIVLNAALWTVQGRDVQVGR